jgi:hypothetical protein
VECPVLSVTQEPGYTLVVSRCMHGRVEGSEWCTYILKIMAFR